ncbi:Surfeit locus protein 1 [Sesamum angolense]|uniref:SURF1-like protein n=1 Tax=Sesamum angolense TaxID=2727404 RepID=A0AAE1WMA5_9LAMI|nr:Surfeit locus protein 1 [Sesamum angolense]
MSLAPNADAVTLHAGDDDVAAALLLPHRPDLEGDITRRRPDLGGYASSARRGERWGAEVLLHLIAQEAIPHVRTTPHFKILVEHRLSMTHLISRVFGNAMFNNYLKSILSEGQRECISFNMSAASISRIVARNLRQRVNPEIPSKWVAQSSLISTSAQSASTAPQPEPSPLALALGKSSEDKKSGNFDSLEFRRVQCKGVFDEKKSIYIGPRSRSISGVTENGYYLITPLIPVPGDPESIKSPILVNRGWVPRSWRDKAIDSSEDEPISSSSSTTSQESAKTSLYFGLQISS